MAEPWFGSEADIRDRLEKSLNQPYWYGAGGIVCPWPYGGPGGGANAPYGFDCSGYVLRSWFLLGLIDPGSKIGRTANDCGHYCEPVATGDQAAGDCAVYSVDGGESYCHIRLVVGPPDSSRNGHSLCYGADGGDSSTQGNDPEACIKEGWGDYWSAFVGYRRIPDNSSTRRSVALGRLINWCAGGSKLSDVVDPSKLPAGMDLTSADEAITKLISYLYPVGV